MELRWGHFETMQKSVQRSVRHARHCAGMFRAVRIRDNKNYDHRWRRKFFGPARSWKVTPFLHFEPILDDIGDVIWNYVARWIFAKSQNEQLVTFCELKMDSRVAHTCGLIWDIPLTPRNSLSTIRNLWSLRKKFPHAADVKTAKPKKAFFQLKIHRAT